MSTMGLTDGTKAIDNTADIIDSREVIERIEYLKSEWTRATGDTPDDYALSEDDWRVGLDDSEAVEIVALQELASEAGDYAADWQYGEALIRDSYFVEYAQELAEDIGAISSDASWPLYCIDWERAAWDLKMDYTSVDFDGVAYWIRS